MSELVVGGCIVVTRRMTAAAERAVLVQSTAKTDLLDGNNFV